MSTSQALGIVGAAVGAYFGGPAGAQWGYAIGSTIGSIIDPEVIKGPDLGDAKQQTSQAGIPIVKVYGLPAPFAGTIIDGDKISRKYTKKQKQGKGGPVVESQGFRATRAILVCEGEAKYARIWRNNKLVYSTMAGDNIDPDSRSFASQLRLYTGTETQLPDPSLESIHGVGNTPYYRGRCYVVIVDDDETQSGGAANQYLFQMASEGSEATETDLRPMLYGGSSYPWKFNSEAARDPRKSGVTYQYAYSGSGPWRDTPQEALDDVSYLGNDINGQPKLIEEPQLMGWSPNSSAYSPGINASPGHDLVPWNDPPVDANTLSTVILAYSRHGFASTTELLVGPIQLSEPTWARDTHSPAGTRRFHSGVVIFSADTLTGFDGNPFSVSGGNWYGYGDIPIFCRALPDCGGAPDGYIEAPDAPGFFVSVDGEVFHEGECAAVTGTYKQLSILVYTAGIDFQPMVTRPVGPVLDSTDANYSDEAWWTDQYEAAVAQGLLPAGLTYSSTGGAAPGTGYPVLITEACECSKSLRLTPGDVIWRDIAWDITSRTPCPVSKLDAAIMTDVVPGFILARADLTGVDYLRALAAPYFCSIPEYDGELHTIRYGGAVVETITDDDILETEDEDDDRRKQEIEAPMRASLFYPDPANKYVVTPQTATRSSPDIQGSSEMNVQTVIPFSADQAAQIVDKMQKVAYSKVEGGFTRALPAQFSRLVPSDPIMFRDHRHIIDKARYEDSMVTIECSYDRASDYTSLAGGANAPTPEPQTSSLKGPTILQVLNLPRLRSQDDKPGMYWAVTGLTPGWPGADIYLSVDGGETEQLVATITDRSVMGELAESIGASGEPIPLRLYDNAELESITDAQMATRQNGFALTTDGVSEVGQVQSPMQDSFGDWDLYDVLRGQLGTTAAPHFVTDKFLLLDKIQFLPIDASHAGRQLIFRAVTLGTAPASNETVTVTFDPLFTGPESIEFLLSETGDNLIAETGGYLQAE